MFSYLDFLVLILSVAMFIATEKFMPIDPASALEIRRKHFWSVMIFLFSFVIGLSLSTIYATMASVQTLRALCGVSP